MVLVDYVFSYSSLSVGDVLHSESELPSFCFLNPFVRAEKYRPQVTSQIHFKGHTIENRIRLVKQTKLPLIQPDHL